MIAELDLAGIVDGFAQPVTRLRYAAPTIVAGRPSYAAPTSGTIAAVVLPLSGAELSRLPEGLRQRARLVAFTSADVRTVQQEGGTRADSLIVDGEMLTCEVDQAYRQLGNYHRLILTKVEP